MLCPVCGKKHRTKSGAKECLRLTRISCGIHCGGPGNLSDFHSEHTTFFRYYEQLR